jgi:hypothetical protein
MHRVDPTLSTRTIGTRELGSRLWTVIRDEAGPVSAGLIASAQRMRIAQVAPLRDLEKGVTPTQGQATSPGRPAELD